MRLLPARLWFAALLVGLPAWLSGGGPQPLAAQGRTHVLIVSGIGGDSLRSDRFVRQALEAAAALRTRFAVDDSLLTLLAEYPARDPRLIRARATREAVRAALQHIAERASAADRVLFLFIGHGSAQSGRPQLALVGPDLSAAELAQWLEPVRASTIAVVLAASASGDFVPLLAGRGRIIVAATRSGAEQNESVFAEHFVTALGSDAADADRNNRVSLLELFRYTRREVLRAYETSNRLLTEHAILDDDGDGVGRADPSGDGPDGRLAHGTVLERAGSLTAIDDPRAAPYLRQRAELERRIAALRAERDGLTTAEYDRRLEELVVQLAQVNRALRALLEKRP